VTVLLALLTAFMCTLIAYFERGEKRGAHAPTFWHNLTLCITAYDKAIIPSVLNLVSIADLIHAVI